MSKPALTSALEDYSKANLTNQITEAFRKKSPSAKSQRSRKRIASGELSAGKGSKKILKADQTTPQSKPSPTSSQALQTIADSKYTPLFKQPQDPRHQPKGTAQTQSPPTTHPRPTLPSPTPHQTNQPQASPWKANAQRCYARQARNSPTSSASRPRRSLTASASRTVLSTHPLTTAPL